MDETAFDRPAGNAVHSAWTSAQCDPREVAHFNDQVIAEDGEAARLWLHRYNPLRLRFVEEMARETGLAAVSGRLNGVSVLDVGCGTGIFCRALADAQANVLGIDPAADCIAEARRLGSVEHKLRYASELVSAQTQTFDIVTAMEVIEHVPDPGLFLADCAARVRPGGLLVLSTINRTMRSWAFAIVMAERVLGLLPRGAHEWRRFVRPCEIEAEFQRLNLKPLACWGASLAFRTRLMQRSSNRSVNFLIAAQKAL